MPFSRFATDPVVSLPGKANVRPGMLALLHQAPADLLGGQAWRGAPRTMKLFAPLAAALVNCGLQCRRPKPAAGARRVTAGESKEHLV
jgi:hypothetical protein